MEKMSVYTEDSDRRIYNKLVEYKLIDPNEPQLAQKCLFCGKYLINNEKIWSYSYFMSHFKCAIDAIIAVSKKYRNIF